MRDVSQTAPTSDRGAFGPLRGIASRGVLIAGLAVAAGPPGSGSAGAMTPTQREALMSVDARGGRFDVQPQLSAKPPSPKTRWEEHGDGLHYYDRYHVEAARQLSGLRVDPTAMPVISRDPEGRVLIRSETPDAVVHLTTDGLAPDTSSRRYDGPLPASASGAVRAVAAAPGLEASQPTPPIE